MKKNLLEWNTTKANGSEANSYKYHIVLKCVVCLFIWASSFANNKGADQPAHPRSLISTFVVRCLDSMICILAIYPKFEDSS